MDPHCQQYQGQGPMPAPGLDLGSLEATRFAMKVLVVAASHYAKVRMMMNEVMCPDVAMMVMARSL